MKKKVWRLSLTTTRDLTEEEYQQYKPLRISWERLELTGHEESRSRLRPDEEVVTRIQLQRKP